MMTKKKLKNNRMIFLQFTKDNYITFMTLLKDDEFLVNDKQRNMKENFRKIYEIEILKKGSK